MMYRTFDVVLNIIEMEQFSLSWALPQKWVHCKALKRYVKCEFVRKLDSRELRSDLIWTFTIPRRRGEDED